MVSCNGCELQLAGRSNIELLPALVGEPQACSLADNRVLPADRAEEFRAVFAWLWSVERLPQGFRWTFLNGPGVERRVRELARREHVCCPFLSFAISTHGEQLIWEGRGLEAGEDLVEEFFALSALAQEPEQDQALTRRSQRTAN